MAACGLPNVAAFGAAFLEANRGKEGVVVMQSGLQYKVLVAGRGDWHPGPTSRCQVLCRATTVS